jgi:hypothetical protein
MMGHVLRCSTPAAKELPKYLSIILIVPTISGLSLNEKGLSSERAAQDEYDQGILVREPVQRGKCQQV